MTRLVITSVCLVAISIGSASAAGEAIAYRSSRLRVFLVH